MVIPLANNYAEPIYFFLPFPCLCVSTISDVLFIKPVLFNCGLRVLEGFWATWKQLCKKLIKKRKFVVGDLKLLYRKLLLQSSPDP